MPTAPTPPAQVDFLFYLRFSAEINEETSVELITDTIQIEVVSFVYTMYAEKQWNLCSACQMAINYCVLKVHSLYSNRGMPSLECL